MRYERFIGAASAHIGLPDICGTINQKDKFLNDAVSSGLSAIAASELPTQMAVTLLHTHFTLSDSEILVEFTTDAGFVVRPVPLGKMANDLQLTPCAWRIRSSHELIPLVWRPMSEVQVSVTDLGNALRGVMLALAPFSEIVGVVLRRHDWSSDTVALEKTDILRREFVSSYVKQIHSAQTNLTTAWFLDDPSDYTMMAGKYFCQVRSRSVCELEEQGGEYGGYYHVQVDKGSEHVSVYI